jgi:hypothetical protein
MEGGVISANLALEGGGVAVSQDGVFDKTGASSGTIFGNNIASLEKNTSSNNIGHSVWIGADAANNFLKTLDNTVGSAKSLTGDYTAWSD